MLARAGGLIPSPTQPTLLCLALERGRVRKGLGVCGAGSAPCWSEGATSSRRFTSCSVWSSRGAPGHPRYSLEEEQQVRRVAAEVGCQVAGSEQLGQAGQLGKEKLLLTTPRRCDPPSTPTAPPAHLGTAQLHAFVPHLPGERQDGGSGQLVGLGALESLQDRGWKAARGR